MSPRLASRNNRISIARSAVLCLTMALGSGAIAHLGAQPMPAATGVEAHVPGSDIVRLDPALNAIIAPGTRVERVASGFKFVEGPMWHQNRLWFSDLVGNKLYAVSREGKVEMLLDHSGGLASFPPGAYLGSNAMAADKDGSVLLIEQGGRKIVRLDKHLAKTTVLDKFEGKRLNSPNDLVFAPDGSLWFTDPPYGLLKQNNDPAKELPFMAFFDTRMANSALRSKTCRRQTGLGSRQMARRFTSRTPALTCTLKNSRLIQMETSLARAG